MKREKFSIIPTAASVILLASCSGFFNGGELKKDLQNKIAYENSPSANIRILGENGVSSPSGDFEKKVTARQNIFFAPYSGYQFIKWQLTDRSTGKVYSDEEASKIIEFENPKSSDTIFTVKKYKDNLLISPLCAEKPQIMTNLPFYKPSGDFRNTTVKIIFDNNMDIGSIYYTGEELKELGITDISSILHGAIQSPVSIESITLEDKVYGYVKDGMQHYKNISITKDDGTNILENFSAPLFITPDILIIPVNTENPPDEYSRVTVYINNFYYLKDGDKIILDNGLKWGYSVNSYIEDTNPATNINGWNSSNENQTFTIYTTWASTISLPDKILYINGSVTDPDFDSHQVAQSGGGAIQHLEIPDIYGSGIEQYFTVELQDPSTYEVLSSSIYYYLGVNQEIRKFNYIENDVTKTFVGYYTSSTFGKDKNEKRAIDFTNVEDGTYLVSINIYDCTNNVTKKYIKIKIGG